MAKNNDGFIPDDGFVPDGFVPDKAAPAPLGSEGNAELARFGLSAEPPKTPKSPVPEKPSVTSRFLGGMGSVLPKDAKEAAVGVGRMALEANKLLHPTAAALSGQEINPRGLVQPMVDTARDVWGAASSGDIAGASGKVAGIVAPAVIGAGVARAMPAVKTATATALDRAGVPAALRESAATQYNRVLGATTKPNKFRSERVVKGYEAQAPDLGEGATTQVPGLIERGVTAVTRKGLEKKLTTAVDQAHAALERAWEDLPGERIIPAERVYRIIDESLTREFTQSAPGGRNTPTGPDTARGLDFGKSLKDYLALHEQMAPGGKPGLSYETLRKFRKEWDDIVSASNGYAGADLTNRVNARAYQSAANGIRDIINGDNPSISAINREVKFWKDAADVMTATNQRTIGQAHPLGRKMARAAGQAVGFGSGGVKGAVLAGEAMNAAEGIMTGAGWRTMSAVAKQRIADAITQEAAKAFRPAGLLAAPDIVTPPPPDTSGPAMLRPYPWETSTMTTPKMLTEGMAPFTQGTTTINPSAMRPPSPPPGRLLEAPIGPQIPRGSGVFTVGAEGQINAPARYTGQQQIPPSRSGPIVETPDTSGPVRPQSIPPRFTPQADPSTIPPSQTGRIIDMNVGPAPRGSMADAEWWAAQPPTRPELQARYEQLFNRAENLSPQRPVRVPELGMPEGVARGMDARENIARQVLNGKPLSQATPTELRIIDDLVAEGYGRAVPPRQTPPDLPPPTR